ncbi:MAG: hypothetical protein Q9190_001796, partial [Brigantiaea leucoxantha]
MFAVPGWSVSADTLKTQKAPRSKGDSRLSEIKKTGSKKKKGGHGISKGTAVNGANFADLWSRYIEGKGAIQPAKNAEGGQKRKRRRKINTDGGGRVEAPPKSVDAYSDGGSITLTSSKDFLNHQEAHDKANRDGLISIEPQGAQSGNRGTSMLDGKTKYEQRKAKAAKKQLERARAQEMGTLAPARSPAGDVKNKREAPVASPASPEERPRDLAPGSSLQANGKLTPLQKSMQSKLVSARFRHLNQILYTTPSHEALQLFSSIPGAYSSYHAGFRSQVNVWPQNPVETFIEDIKRRGSVRTSSQKQLWREERKNGAKKRKLMEPVQGSNITSDANDAEPKIDPLPRSKGTSTIADLGCGDATLHASLLPLSSALNLRFHSFDLSKDASLNAHLVTVADIANLPLADGSADVAILCLALMGTNWISFVEEASRILRSGGECWVAEIKSRFARAEKRMAIGEDKRKKVKGRKFDRAEDVEGSMAVVEEEEEGGRDKTVDETDVSAFVEVLRRRGFSLRGEADLENKMFVRMRFVKNLAATTGKGDSGGGKGVLETRTKFLEVGNDEMEIEDEDEAKVLKPCTYKT